MNLRRARLGATRRRRRTSTTIVGTRLWVDGFDAEKSNKEGDEEEEKNLDSEAVNGLQV